MSKHQVLVVDDELIFRKGLTHVINGFDLDWEVCGEAKDGLEALEMIRHLQPQLIITDIRMPQMDGVQLQAAVADQYPGISCIVLSGYDDFEYARSSIRSGARDYLLKPVQKDELQAALLRVSEELADRAAEQAAEDMSEQHLRVQLLSGLVHGHMAYDAAELLEDAGLSFTAGKGIYCLIAQLDRGSIAEQRYHQNDPELFLLYIQQFMREVVLEELHGYTFMEQGKVVALVQMDMGAVSEAQLTTLCDRLVRTIRRVSKLTITIGIGRGAAELEGVPRSYREAEVALLYRLTAGGDRVLSYQSQATADEQEHPVRLPSADRHTLEQLLGRTHEHELHEQVQQLVERLCHQLRRPEMIQQQVCRIIMESYEIALDYGVAESWLNDSDIGIVLQQVLTINDRRELADYCSRRLHELYMLLRGRENQATHAVDRAVQYMEQHYAEHITLGLMAEQVYLNASYLSSLFKSRLGQSFVEVLTGIRIREAARRLAQSDEKVVSIAVATGFVNIRHFNRVFKTEMEVTPKQYRDRMRSFASPHEEKGGSRSV
ncbi:response regulator [Paenibacillus kandeliae]|uniref:response regulator n=1 Tax=Paenibacillus kandeliae TaxID=3231269 RepID=UPI003457F59D